MIAASAALFLAGVSGAQAGSGQTQEDASAVPDQAVVYKTPWCGCCSGYVDYLEQHGIAVEVHDLEDLDMVKRMAGVPEEMESCHTMRIGDYTVEGHVPMPAIEQLFKERPEISGIAAPGMPAGSPGMGGAPESYTVYGYTDGRRGDAMMTIDPQ
jgi:hypothetical protein